MPEKTTIWADPTTSSNRYAGSPAFDALSDGQLLEMFVRRREESAFAALVRRHGPMVLSVCRRVLRHSQDAEDAFQATFLVLVEKAPRLRQPELLANWRVLDEELHRLPEKYRAPLVLCYLEGKTNEEAARVLGWPAGSMSHRLARGRELLRERLEARLAGLAVLLPAIWLAEHLQPVVVSPLLAKTTVQAAVALMGAKVAAAGAGIISASVRQLTEATLESLAPSRWRWLFPALLIVALLLGVSAAVGIAYGGWTSTDPASCGCSH
jgi:DNA-directed RNA polymerase specialized sigma24 family protein